MEITDDAHGRGENLMSVGTDTRGNLFDWQMVLCFRLTTGDVFPKMPDTCNRSSIGFGKKLLFLPTMRDFPP